MVLPAPKPSDRKFFLSASQLTGVNGSGTYHDRAYEYDAGGNRLSDALTSFAIGPYNRLQSDDLYAYEYDDEGNLIRKTTEDGNYAVFTWDHRNRLIEVASYNDEDEPTGDQTYAYDAFNQVVEVGGSVFVYDGGQAVLRFEGSDLKERYLWGAAVDELLATESVGSLTNAALNETLWALADAQGTVRDVADNNGVQRKHVDYDAFGGIKSESWYYENGLPIEGTDPWANSQAVDQVFYYTGRLLDKATGLQNNLNRWYDASIGRWLSEDPIGFGGGDANLYRYVGNSPTSKTDSSGLHPDDGIPWFGPGSDIRRPLPEPEPPGGPPAGIPGGPWKRIDPVAPGRRPKWSPINPPKGQSPPDISWDPGPPGHWDYHDGLGNTQRYDRDGRPITPGQAHGREPIIGGRDTIIGGLAFGIGTACGWWIGSGLPILTPWPDPY